MLESGTPFKLVFTPTAVQSIEDQVIFLASSMAHDEASAHRCLVGLIDQLHERLCTFPSGYPVSPEASELGILQYRRVVIGSFRIFYEIREQSSEVLVLLVMRQRQSIEKALIRYCLVKPLS